MLLFSTRNESARLRRVNGCETYAVVAVVKHGVEEADKCIAEDPQRVAIRVSHIGWRENGDTDRSRILQKYKFKNQFYLLFA